MAVNEQLLEEMAARATKIKTLREQLQLPDFDFQTDPLGPIANLGAQLADDVLELQRDHHEES